MEFDLQTQKTILKKEFDALSVRSRHVIENMGGEWDFGRVLSLTEDILLARKNAGRKTASEILTLRRRIAGFCEGQVLPRQAENEGRCELDLTAHLPEPLLLKLSARTRHILEKLFRHPTVGDVFGLTKDMIMGVRGAGRKSTSELLAFREFLKTKSSPDDGFVSASDYPSLEAFVLKVAEVCGAATQRRLFVIRNHLGLLNSESASNLEEVGKMLGVTRERVHQIARRVKSLLFSGNRTWDQISNLVVGIMRENRLELAEGLIIAHVEKAFGWTGTTMFSICRLLAFRGIELVRLPDGHTWGLNERGRYDWVATYRPPTKIQIRYGLIKGVLTDRGTSGMTAEEIVAECRARAPDAGFSTQTVRSILANPRSLDGEGCRIIPFDRGTAKGSRTAYTLNILFKDEKTQQLLNEAAAAVKSYMEETGLGVVSVWKIWTRFRDRMPVRMPKMGFYMMMRDIKAGGLSYHSYPKISYPGIEACDGVYAWELYEYFSFCGKKTATFAEIMYFFIECLGLQPEIALACAFHAMHLKKVAEDDSSSSYELKPPKTNGGKAPLVLLPAISSHFDFSLVKVSGKARVNPYFLDETGKALTHGVYAQLFFRSLEDAKFVFPQEEIDGLLDKGWCRYVFNASHPVFKRVSTEGALRLSGFWRQVFSFGGEQFMISSDWGPRNKTKFDVWACRIASVAGISFEPYDVPGMGTRSSVEEES